MFFKFHNYLFQLIFWYFWLSKSEKNKWINQSISYDRQQYLVFILCVVKPRYWSTTNAVAISSASHNSAGVIGIWLFTLNKDLFWFCCCCDIRIVSIRSIKFVHYTEFNYDHKMDNQTEWKQYSSIYITPTSKIILMKIME